MKKLLSLFAKSVIVVLCAMMWLIALLMLIVVVSVANYTICTAVGYAVILFVAWCTFSYLSNSRLFSRFELLILMALCFLVHLAFIGVLPSLGQNGMTQYLDGLVSFIAQNSGKICFEHRSYMYYWCNYEILLSTLGILFGKSFCVGQILNAFCCVVALLPMYKIAEEVSSKNMARFSVLAMGLSPTVIMYSTTYTGEFLSATFMIYAAYFLIKYYDAESISNEAVGASVLSGVFLGLAYLFKSIRFIFILAMLIHLGVAAMISYNLRNLFRYVFVAVIIIGTSLLISSIGQSALSAIAEKPITRYLGSTVMYELAQGLNLKSDGGFSRELGRQLHRMDAAQQRAFAWEAIKRDWRSYPALMVKKFIRLHGSPSSKSGCIDVFRHSFRAVATDRTGRTSSMPHWVIPLTNSETLVNKILFLLGFTGIFIQSIRKRVSFGRYFFFVLVVLEFTFMLQLIEGHGRYKAVIYPFYFASIPYGYVLFSELGNLWKHIKGSMRNAHGNATAHTHIS